MDHLDFGLYVYEFVYPNRISHLESKVFRIEVYDFKNKKNYVGILGDRHKLKSYDFPLKEYNYKYIIPIDEKRFLQLLDTWVEDIIGKNKSVLFTLIDSKEWLI